MNEITKCIFDIDELSVNLHTTRCILSLVVASVEGSYQMIPKSKGQPLLYDTNVSILNRVLGDMINLEEELDKLTQAAMTATKQGVAREN